MADLPKTTWNRKDIESAALHWRAVSQMEESEMFDAKTIAMADGYASAFELALRNIPQFSTISQLAAWYAHRHRRQLTLAEADLLTDIVKDFHVYPKEVQS